MLGCAILLLFHAVVYATKIIFELSIGMNRLNNLLETNHLMLLIAAASMRFAFVTSIITLPADMDD